MRRHGIYSTYTNHKCRCGPCKDAAREYNRKARPLKPSIHDLAPTDRLASQTWREQAACKGMSLDVFYGPEIIGRGHAAGRRWTEDIALRVCQACDVTSECLAHALDHDEEHGVWGATTPQDRDALRRLRRRRGEVAS